ncbi:PAS domain-containing sensor histidine kinase [Paludisphaera rhizosphaerae]|uniref:PAS domain-containing sensor histidine kinase n=1 Tax=Paludisphaera rhizosphaerae TaxID=2711216 RepID=UPI0013ED3488|nr:ATP-binding protein [Paludisphaera rhizosphaerae]
MSESGRKPTPPIVLIVVAVLATAVGWFAIERLAMIAEHTAGEGAVSHSWHLIAIQALILAILCLVGTSLWLLRRRDEARDGETGLLAVLDAAPDGMALIDGSCRIVLANARVEAMFGYHRDELLGRSIEVLLPDAPRFLGARTDPDAAPILRADLGALRGLETKGRRKNGSSIPLEVSFGVVGRREEVAVAACVLHDVSDRLGEEARLREAYRALRFANDRLRGVVEGTSDMIAALDRDGRYILLNDAYRRAFQRLFGCRVEQGMRLEEALESRPEDLSRLKSRWDRALAGERYKDMAIYPDGDGALSHLEVAFNPIRDEQGTLIGAGQLIRDVTDRVEAHEALRRNAAQLEALGASREQAYAALQHAYEELKLAESRLVQAEKLSALGQLIAGVAHEINNPLAFVGNDLAILQRDVANLMRLIQLYRQAASTLAERHPELAAEIADTAEEMDLEYALEHLNGLTSRARDGLGRIRRIVKDLRDFARLDEGEKDDADLSAGLASTVNIVAGLARDRQVEVVTDLPPLPTVTCSPGKINQVVLNLLINAIDASRTGGKVTLRTRQDGPEGVAIDVIDEGVGIPPDVRGRIFDPFFTTKPVGKGTGLGLSISYGIVQEHGGRIEVDSTPDVGSRFTIHLPLRPPPKEAPALAVAETLRDGN